MRFTEDFIEKVKDANDVVDIIGQYTELKRGGTNFMGLCPFPDHREKSPSFSVSPNKQMYHCFGCKKGGNVFTFLQTYNGMSFVESIEYLAKRAHIELPEPEKFNPQADQQKSQKEYLLRVNQATAQFYHKQFLQLADNHPAKEYAKSRGLDKDIIEKFMIGFGTEAWDSLVQFSMAKQMSLKAVNSLGLIKAKQNGNSYFDLFRNRIMFPIVSPSGEVLGFGGRSIDGSNPKYLNSPDSPVFHKSKILYGLNEAAKYIRTEDFVIVVEGYMDLIAMYKFGFKNVVANLGTAFTEQHAKLIKRYTNRVVLLFDGDSAGQTAAERAAPILWEEGLQLRTLCLADEYDPDEFLNEKGAEALAQEIQSAPDTLHWLLSKKMQNYRGQASETLEVIEYISMFLSKIEDNRLRSLYIRHIADVMGQDLNWTQKAVFDSIKIFKEKNMNFRKPDLQIQESNLGMPGMDRRNLNTVNQGNYNVPSAVANNSNANLGYLRDAQSQNLSPMMFDLSQAQAEEVELLNILMCEEKFLKESTKFESLANSIPMFKSEKTKEIFNWVIAQYRQMPQNFDKLASLLTSKIKQPGIITKYIGQYDANNPVDEENLQRLFRDCIQRIELKYAKSELKRLQQELKLHGKSEKLEQVMQIINKYKLRPKGNLEDEQR